MAKRALMIILALSFIAIIGCKKEGVVLVTAGLRDEPKTAKGTYKWLKNVNRGQIVSIVKEKDDEWYQVELPDGITKGWIEQKYVHKGKAVIISFTDQTKLYDQPDLNSKVNGTFPAGTKAIVINDKGDWYNVNVKYGQSGWLQKGSFQQDSQVKSQERYEVYVSGIGKCFVEASSTLADSGGYSYTVKNLFDGNPATAWQEGSDGNGEGEWIEVSLPGPSNVNLSMINGMVKKDSKFASYGADGDLYQLNSRVRSMRVESWDAEGGQHTMEVSFEDNYPDYQTIGDFNNVTKIRLVIDGVYSGIKWQDTSVGELKIKKSF
jgi:SH3-like domain-containing protein